jgi:hypothetical protein
VTPAFLSVGALWIVSDNGAMSEQPIQRGVNPTTDLSSDDAIQNFLWDPPPTRTPA